MQLERVEGLPARRNIRLLFMLALGAATLSGAGLRLYRLGDQTLATDEIASVVIARKPVSSIVEMNLFPETAESAPEQPPLHYILMHYCLPRIRNSDFLARLPSAIMGILTLPVLFFLALRLAGREAAIAAAFVAATSFYHILYSQEARSYTGLMLFSALSLLLLLRSVQSGRRADWFAFAGVNVLAVYTHYAALQVLMIETVVFVLLLLPEELKGKRPGRLRSYAISIAIIALAAAPLYRNILGIARARLGGDTIPFELSASYLGNLLARYGAGYGTALILYSICFLLGIFRIWRLSPLGACVLIVWTVLPFALTARSGYQYFFHLRYFSAVFPVYIILVAAGSTFPVDFLRHRSGKRRWPALLAAAAVIVPLAVVTTALRNLPDYYRMPARMTDWKAVAGFVSRHYEPGVEIYIESSYCIKELGYYLAPLAPEISLRSVEGDKAAFLRLLDSGRRVWYIDSSPVFDSLVLSRFERKVVFGSPVFRELGERGLIDWTDSWFSAANIRRYYPVLYLDEPWPGERSKSVPSGNEGR